MSWFGIRTFIRATALTALPGLRVIGMAYTGLIGLAAVVLVVSVAFLPASPVLEGGTPVREAVGSMVLPATDAVGSIAGFRRATPDAESVPVVSSPPITVALASELAAAEVNVGDVGADASTRPPATDGPPAVVDLPRAPTTHVVVTSRPAAPVPVAEDADPVAEDVPAEQSEQPIAAIERAPAQPMLVADPQVQQAADVEPPRPLPTPPRPTLTASQSKARSDAENQAAIDSVKAALARRKAESDAANQAAIDARKAAASMRASPHAPTIVAESTHAPAPQPAAEPTPAAVRLAAAPRSVADANALNQAQIDSARAAATRAKYEANAANQAAIDAARAAKSLPTATPKSMPAPTSMPAALAISPPTRSTEPAPTPPIEPPATTPMRAVADPAAGGSLDEQPLEQDEAPVMLALDPPGS